MATLLRLLSRNVYIVVPVQLYVGHSHRTRSDGFLGTYRMTMKTIVGIHSPRDRTTRERPAYTID